MDRDLVHRQTAAFVVQHISLGVAGLGCEDAITHLLNYVWPNIFENSPHVVQAVTGAVDGCRLALGPCVVLHYVLQVGPPHCSPLHVRCSGGVWLFAQLSHHTFRVTVASSLLLTLPASTTFTPNSQGLWHPARKVREVYWRLYNNLYIGAQDAVVAFAPRLEDDAHNSYQRHELDLVL